MKIVDMTKYRLHRYFYSSRPVIPFIIIVCFIRIMYSVKPMGVCSGYILSGVLQFVLLTFVTLNMNGNEKIVEEQLLFFRGHRWSVYCIAREITFLLISCFYGAMLAIGPVIVNCFNEFSFFNRRLTVEDVGLGAIIIFGNGFAGIAIGDVLHPRIMNDRKMAIITAVGIMVLSIVKDAIIEKCSAFVFIGIFLPSVMKAARDLGNEDYFKIQSVIVFILMMVLYYLVIATVKNLVLARKKFL